MEKIIIESIVDTGRKTKDGNPVIEITTSDGRTGSGFDKLLLTYNVGQEVEVEVKKAPEYQGNERWYFMLPKPAGQQQGKFPAKDWTLEKRKASYELAVKTAELLEVKLKKSDDIFPIAEKIFEYLNKK